MKNSIAMIAVAGLAASASAQVQEFRLFDNGTLNNGVQIEDNSSPFFMNAQGNDPTSSPSGFEEFYVMEFDLSAYTSGAVASVEIDLTHSEPFFASTGGVSIDYTADDSTALSGLTFDTGSVGGNNGQLAAADVADFQFVAGNDGVTFTFNLADNGGLFSDIQSGGLIRLILEATDPGTAATYEGFDGDRGDGGPVLRVTAVPTPGAAAILGLGGLVAARRRRA